MEEAMDPKKLLYFASVIECGSLKKAAKLLSISQPALSTSISRLEDSLGKKLLERSPSGVTPTPLGELLYSHARLIRDELALAENHVKGLDPTSEGSLTFGALPSLSSRILPQALKSWRRTHPRQTLRVVENVQLELLLSLIRGEVEFIVAQTESYGQRDGLMQRVLFRDRLHVVCRHGHAATQIENVQWSDLAKFPWIIQMIGKQRTLLEKILHSDRVGWPQQLTEGSSVDFIKAVVKSSEALAMLPGSAIGADMCDGQIQSLNIVEPLMHRDIAVLYREHSPLSATARALVDVIAEASISHIVEHSFGELEPVAA
jgi:DNA-binding transcriptional LysR family regulator